MSDEAEAYFAQLLAQGYPKEQAEGYTKQYFPNFHLESSIVENVNLEPQIENHNQLPTEEDERSQFIPIPKSELMESILQLPGHSNEREQFKNLITMLEAIWHHDFHYSLEELKSSYLKLDPDEAVNPVTIGQESERFLETLDQVMIDGNWDVITDDDLQVAFDEEDLLPISLTVRTEEYEFLKMYRLGRRYDNVETKKLFGLKSETLNVEIYPKVVTVLGFKSESWFTEDKKRKKNYPGVDANGVHVRLFKEVPHLDMEVIFPNTSPNMRTLEKIKIGAPLVGGIVSIILKYAPVVFGNSSSGDTGLAILGGILAGLGTYVFKTYMSYQKTREKFINQVAKDLYFKGIANNKSVLTYLVDMSEEQEIKEAVLAYSFISRNQGNFNEESLDSSIEKWLNETFGFDIDFEVDDALAKLEKMNLLKTAPDGSLTVVNLEEALSILDDYWDNIYDF